MTDQGFNIKELTTDSSYYDEIEQERLVNAVQSYKSKLAPNEYSILEKITEVISESVFAKELSAAYGLRVRLLSINSAPHMYLRDRIYIEPFKDSRGKTYFQYELVSAIEH